MKFSVKITPDMEKMFRDLGSDVNAARRAGMINLIEDIEARAVKLTPVVTSHLVNTETSEIKDDGRIGIIKATAKYARFVHDGTGRYGPYKKDIVIIPSKAKALYWPGAKHPVRRVTQKGIKGNPFFLKALKQISPGEVYEEGVRKYLQSKGRM